MTRATLVVFLFLALAADAQDRRRSRAAKRSEWIIGKVQRVVAIGGESSGWKVGELEVEGKSAELAGLEGRRIAVFGAKKTRRFLERGFMKVFVIGEIAELEAAKHDLKIHGKLRLLDRLSDTKAPVRAAILLLEDWKIPDRPALFVRSVVNRQRRYEITLPAIKGKEGWIYRIFCWVDSNRNGRFDAREPSSALRAKEDLLTLSFTPEKRWLANGSVRQEIKTPHEQAIMVESE